MYDNLFGKINVIVTVTFGPVTIILVRRKFWSGGTKISEKFGPPLKILVRADDRALREKVEPWSSW